MELCRIVVKSVNGGLLRAVPRSEHCRDRAERRRNRYGSCATLRALKPCDRISGVICHCVRDRARPALQPRRRRGVADVAQNAPGIRDRIPNIAKRPRRGHFLEVERILRSQ
jgi:hypothetical protein